MGDAATRFDKIVNTEEKKKRTNAFVKSNSILKGASDKEDADIGNDVRTVAEDAPETEKADSVQNDVKPQSAKREKEKKSLVLDKSGKLDLKSCL